MGASRALPYLLCLFVGRMKRTPRLGFEPRIPVRELALKASAIPGYATEAYMRRAEPCFYALCLYG